MKRRLLFWMIASVLASVVYGLVVLGWRGPGFVLMILAGSIVLNVTLVALAYAVLRLVDRLRA